jgi:hypothetical protein
MPAFDADSQPTNGFCALKRSLPAGLAVCLAVVAGGCQTGRQWSRTNADSLTPSLGVERSAEQIPESAERPIANAGSEPPPVETAALPQSPEERPRRLIPDWLRLGKEEDPVPLPTTQPLDAAAPVASAGGPVEEFQ